jgi:hypothetical protein
MSHERDDDRLSQELQQETNGGQRLSEGDVRSSDRLDDGDLSESEQLPGDED